MILMTFELTLLHLKKRLKIINSAVQHHLEKQLLCVNIELSQNQTFIH